MLSAPAWLPSEPMPVRTLPVAVVGPSSLTASVSFAASGESSSIDTVSVVATVAVPSETLTGTVKVLTSSTFAPA